MAEKRVRKSVEQYVPEPFDPVIIVWVDAEGKDDNYNSPSEALDDYVPCVRKTHGLWVGRTKQDGIEAIVTAQDDDRNKECPAALGSCTYTPSSLVLKILRPVRTRKRRKARAVEPSGDGNALQT
jgi:hypothetical protein